MGPPHILVPRRPTRIRPAERIQEVDTLSAWRFFFESSKYFSAFDNFDSGQVEVRHAPEVVEMDEKPIAGIKGKKNSSMALALQSVKNQEAQALLSCGNTGCLMAGSTIRLRTLEGVERPALCTIWPGRERYFTLLDAGANPHAKPYHIAQNAILGSNYARVAL